MKANAIRERTYRFALDVVLLYRELVAGRELVLGRQLLRSGTSIGANVEEAIAAQSRRDFIAKLAIARKEARETNYWLRLLRDSGIGETERVAPLERESAILVRILTAIILATERGSSAGGNS